MAWVGTRLVMRCTGLAWAVQGTSPCVWGASAYTWLVGLGLRYQAHYRWTGARPPLPTGDSIALLGSAYGQRTVVEIVRVLLARALLSAYAGLGY